MEKKHVSTVVKAYMDWCCLEGLSVAVSIAQAMENDCNLSPNRYVPDGEQDEGMSLDEALLLFEQAEEDRVEADARLKDVGGNGAMTASIFGGDRVSGWEKTKLSCLLREVDIRGIDWGTRT